MEIIKNIIFNISIFLIVFWLGIITILVNILKLFFFKNKDIEKRKLTYEKKDFMTIVERDFYNKIKVLEESKYNYRIIPQLNLASIVKKINNNYYYTDLFRNIDFAIFDKDYKKVLVLIELNDNTHKIKKRQARDIKVQQICNEIGIPLLKFYPNYPNETSYVINKIIKTITNTTSKDN